MPWYVCQVALLDQAEDFVPQKLPSLRKLLDEFQAQVPVQAPALAKESLDADQCQLLLKQLDYDIKVFENWERKCQHVHVARFHAKKAWKLERQQRAAAAATAYLGQTMRHQVWSKKGEDIISEVMSFRRDIMQKLGAIDSDGIPMMVFANLSAPCELNKGTQDCHLCLATCLATFVLPPLSCHLCLATTCHH